MRGCMHGVLMRCLAALLPSALAWSAAAATATDCTRQPVAPARAHAVGTDMVVNGLPTRVLTMEFAGTAEAVSDAWRQYWTREGVPARGQRAGGQYVLSAIDGLCHYVLSLEPRPAPGGYVAGIFSVSKLAPVASGAGLGELGLPPGAKVLSDVQSTDRGQRGRTLVVRLPGNAQGARQRAADRLAAQGWSSVVQMPAPMADGSGRIEGLTLAMQRQQERMDATFVDRAGQTDAVITVARPE
ncbi:hypothetical protein KB879_04860 [Cupriavidus sp. KK10]|nr:hypothetical protein KB879_04860 [Cupriavidus sp. KK10]